MTDAQLAQISAQMRLTLCRVSQQTGTPHLACSLSCIDLLASLYWQVLHIDPDTPLMVERDYFLLSKGHAASALYTALAYRGFFEIEQLFEHGKDGSPLEEHPGVHAPAGVESVSGSLGHALSLAAGMAVACRIQQQDNQFYVLMGDGELNEGTIWEAAMFIGGHKLSQVTAIVDFNKWQGTGRSCDIMHLEPLEDKWKAFGWQVLRIDGHDLSAIYQAFSTAKTIDQPVCIIADTVKGSGISFMQDDNNWHYRIPTAEEVTLAAQELGLESMQP
jgi:transketolase